MATPRKNTWRKHYAYYQAALNELGEAIYEDAPRLRGDDASTHLLNGWRWCDNHDVPQPMFKDAVDKHESLGRVGLEVYRDVEERDD
jgi:hypothetical protein